MSREAMQMALDMLNEIADDVYCDQKLEGVITALRQALVDADDTSQERVDEIVKTEHDKQIEIALAYQRGWDAALAQREWVPEALRLADALDAEFVQGRISNSTGRESAVELRRLALKQWVGLTDEEIDALSQARSLTDELMDCVEACTTWCGLCGRNPWHRNQP